MSLLIPNLDRLAKMEPKLGEALKKIQDYSNQNIAPQAGNRLNAPTFINPTQRPG